MKTNNWLQIIAKIGNKMVTLSLYRNLSHMFCHFWQHFASKICQKWQFFIDLKVAKNDKWTYLSELQVGMKLLLRLH